MKKSFGPVWVLAEQAECEVEAVSFQLVGKAAEMAGELGTACEAIILGHDLDKSAPALIAAGADRVYAARAPVLEYYQPLLFRKIVCSLAAEHRPEIILVGSTCMGRELAPLIAAGLGTGLGAHCTGLRINQEGLLEQIIPAYGGLMTIVCPEKRPQMATVAGGVFRMPDLDWTRSGEVVPVAVPEPDDWPVRTIKVIREESSEIQLDSARVIVSGGAGAGDSDGWKLVRELAGELQAAVGCTRPAVDEGLAPLHCMIGQSGRMVNPEVYIGAGLSGEQQHMVGINGAKLMVAINNDPKSPVFQQVDLGIVEDWRAFAPVLIQKIRAYREAKTGCAPSRN
ncbi:MAG: electron transfer flavoprotein subunit alpha/FixB family protein [Syntrophobacteraceae bacterium]